MRERIEAIVREAGQLSLQFFGTLAAGDVAFKGEADLVTRADREVEALLRERLTRAFPGAGFIGEEGTDTPADSSGLTFIVDPIDGTTNFVHSLPLYAVSVALNDTHGPRAGAVFAPALGDLYYAERGRGAWKNRERIRVSSTSTLMHSLAATGFACVRERLTRNNLPAFAEASFQLRGIRRFGSASLDLCYVADGRFELYWEMNLHRWDIAAGALVVTEAGGRVTDLSGGPHYAERGEILASNGHVHESFLNLLGSVQAPGAVS